MPTPRELGDLQESILDSIKAAHVDPRTGKAPKQGEIAAVAGVSDATGTNWKNGVSEMRLGELVLLIRRYGAAAVLGPIAALDKADVCAKDAPGDACPRTFLRYSGRGVEHVSSATDPASPGGERWTAEEGRQRLPDMYKLLEQVKAQIAAAEAAVAKGAA